MAQVTPLPKASIIRHQPQLMREEQAKADAIIEYARKVKDWPLLEEAINAKIEQQQEFVQWWGKTVGVRLNANSKVNADLSSPVSRVDAERLTGILQQQVSRWRKKLDNPDRYRERMIQAAMRAAELRAAANHRAEGTGENEWFTPAEYIEAARLVLEEIDLDPATHPIAQETIKASHFFTRADNSLNREWHGRVWLNPPYGRGEIGPFIDKLVHEIEAGHVTAAVLLTHNYTDTEWWHRAFPAMQALCFTRGRVKFIDEEGEPCAPTQGQVFFYFGPDVEEFAAVFNAFGAISAPWVAPL
jgi:phage N-6-adenine-methyltransferase